MRSGAPTTTGSSRSSAVTIPATSSGSTTTSSHNSSVRDAGELLAGVLQLAGPRAGPAESAGGLAAHVGGRGAAGEVDVLAPVHPPRVGPAVIAREVPGQLPEEPVHDLGLPAVPPKRVEPVAEPAGSAAREIVAVAGEPAVDALGLAVHAQRRVQVIDVELGPLAVPPDLIRRRAVEAVVGALHGMPDLMSGQLAGEGVSLPPVFKTAVADVVVVVDRADVIARMAAAVPPGVVDGVDARVGPERLPVGCLGVLPGHVYEPGQPSNLGPAHIGVGVDLGGRRCSTAGAAGGGRTSAPARWLAGQAASAPALRSPCPPMYLCPDPLPLISILHRGSGPARILSLQRPRERSGP